jgi:hypothetical protein
MAARTPIKLDGSNVKEMSSTDYNNIVARTAYLYMTDPSVTLSQVGSSGSLDSMNDTRTQAGSATTHASSFRSAGDTPDVSTVTVTYDKITEATASLSAPADTNSIRFPVWNNGGNIQAMTVQEMYDTYVSAATDSLIASQPYKIHTSTSSPSGYTIVSSTAVFTDTIANAGAYTAGGITETQDQPTTVTNYYLHRNTGSSVSYSATPMYIDASQNLKEYTSAEFDAIMKEVIRYSTVNSGDSCRLRYYIGGAGTNMGSGIVNTKLNSSTYAQREVGGDDYRTQEFPSGSAATISTYYLKARKY